MSLCGLPSPSLVLTRATEMPERLSNLKLGWRERVKTQRVVRDLERRGILVSRHIDGLGRAYEAPELLEAVAAPSALNDDAP